MFSTSCIFGCDLTSAETAHLHMALIVLDRRSPAHKGEVFLLTIRDQLLIEELRAAIGVNAQQGKREERAGLL